MFKLNSLMYHGIREAPGRGGRYTFTLDEFRGHLDSIAETAGGAPWILGAAPGTSGFAVTFDDGDAGWPRAAEALLERGWKAFFFVVTGALGRPGGLTKADLRRLSAMGHVIGSHTVDHPAHLDLREDGYIRDQWSRSKAALEDTIGREVTSASVPGGSYSARVARAAEAAGLETLFTSEPVARSWSVGRCRMLGRFALENGMTGRQIARLAAGSRPAAAGRYLAWNVKKALKRAFR